MHFSNCELLNWNAHWWCWWWDNRCDTALTKDWLIHFVAFLQRWVEMNAFSSNQDCNPMCVEQLTSSPDVHLDNSDDIQWKQCVTHKRECQKVLHSSPSIDWCVNEVMAFIKQTKMWHSRTNLVCDENITRMTSWTSIPHWNQVQWIDDCHMHSLSSSHFCTLSNHSSFDVCVIMQFCSVSQTLDTMTIEFVFDFC